MKIKKVYIILIVIGILYFSLLFYFVVHKESQGYLFLSDSTLLTVKKGKWSRVSLNELSDVTMYSDSNLLEECTLTKKNNVYTIIGNSGREHYVYDTPLLGYTKGMKIEVEEFTREEMTEDEISNLNNILEGYEIKGYSMLTSSQKITFDFDKDGVDETIYAASNAFIESEYDKVFSIVYYVDNANTNVLYINSDSVDNLYNVGRSYLHSVINYEKNKTYEIIVGIENFDQSNNEYQMYAFEKGTPKLIFDVK